MAVVIRLMRAGAKKRPFFRLVAADSRRQRDGRFLEILGHYDPISKNADLVVHKEKVDVWIARGARPSEQVASLLRRAGVSTSAPKTGPRVAPAAPIAAGEPAAAPAPKKKAVKKAAAKPAKRAVKRKVSGRKVKAKAARKAGKKAPAAKKSAKK